MGEVTRGTIAPNEFGLPLGAFVTLAIWCLLGFGVTYAAMARRGLTWWLRLAAIARRG